MGLTDAIFSLADPYDRQARLYPALLAMAPAVLTVGTLYAAQATLLTSAAALLVTCGVMFWLANLARDRGKNLEPDLFRAWGGKPSVQLLRHADLRIDPVTKQRYHVIIGGGMQVELPTAEVEAQEPARADAIYESATKWLLEKTRDSKRFALLFKENVSYGFRRNLLGVKPYGAAIAVASLLWSLVASGLVQDYEPSSFTGRIAALSPSEIVAISATSFLVTLWLTGATKSRVKIAAFAYAERLLAACESLEVVPKKRGQGAQK